MSDQASELDKLYRERAKPPRPAKRAQGEALSKSVSRMSLLRGAWNRADSFKPARPITLAKDAGEWCLRLPAAAPDELEE
jgi:hypothetical protein